MYLCMCCCSLWCDLFVKMIPVDVFPVAFHQYSVPLCFLRYFKGELQNSFVVFCGPKEDVT